MFAGERATLNWEWTGEPQPRALVKLAMLLATFALTAVPRGGTVTVRSIDGGVWVEAESDTVRTPPGAELLNGGEVSDPRSVQPVCIARLAESCGLGMEIAERGGAVTFRTVAR